MIDRKKWFFLIAFLTFVLGSLNAQWQKTEPKTRNDRSVDITCIAFLDHLAFMGTTAGGVMKFDGSNYTFIDMSSGLVSNEIRDLAADGNGDLWIATNKGVDVWNPKKIVHYTKGLQKDAIKIETDDFLSVHIDDDGNAWMGTSKGLYKRTAADKWFFYDQKSTGKSLPSNEIKAIHSTWDAVIWMATDRGLVSFDGKEWKTYNRDSHGFPTDDIYDVYASADGTVWMGTAKGVLRFNGIKADQFLKDKRIRSVTLDMLGNAWAATKDEGVYLISEGTETLFTQKKDGIITDELLSVETDRDNGIWIGGLNGFSQYTDKTKAKEIAKVFFEKARNAHLLGQYVTATRYFNMFLRKDYLQSAPEVPEAMYRIAQMYLYIGQPDKGFELLTEFVSRYGKHELAKSAILQLADFHRSKKKVTEGQKYYQMFLDNYPDDPATESVMLRMAWLFESDGDTFGAARILQKINNKYPNNLRFDENRWKIAVMEEKQKGKVASEPVYLDLAKTSVDMEILYRLSEQYDQNHRKDILDDMRGGVEWKTYEVGSAVNHLFQEGTNMWVATQANGVLKCDFNIGALTPYVDGLPGKDIRQIYMDADRDVWAVLNGNSKNALVNMQYSKNRTKWNLTWAPFNNKIINWFIYKPMNKWKIAASDQGIFISPGAKNYSTKNGLPGNNVKFLALDSRAVLWAVVDKYLVQIDNEPKVIVSTGEVNFNDIRYFYIDSRDTKWLATDKGIVTYDGAWKQYTVDDGLISNNTLCVVGSRSGMILAGTKEGLSFFNNTFWMNYTTEDGLPSNDVRAVVFGDDASIWIGTDKGVHYRKSTGDGDKKLMVQNVLAKEKQLWEKQQYAKARELYDILTIYPDLSEWIAAKKAICFEKEGSLDNAYQAYQNIRANNPSSRWITDLHIYRVARKFEDSSRTEPAIRIYTDLAARVKGDAKKSFRIEESLFRSARLYQDKNETAKALALYRQILQMYPGGSMVPMIADQYLALLKSNEQSKDMDQCITLSEEFLKIYPKHEKELEIRFGLAECYVNANKPAEAEKVYASIAADYAKSSVKLLAEQRLAKIRRMTAR